LISANNRVYVRTRSISWAHWCWYVGISWLILTMTWTDSVKRIQDILEARPAT